MNEHLKNHTKMQICSSRQSVLRTSSMINKFSTFTFAFEASLLFEAKFHKIHSFFCASFIFNMPLGIICETERENKKTTRNCCNFTSISTHKLCAMQNIPSAIFAFQLENVTDMLDTHTTSIGMARPFRFSKTL